MANWYVNAATGVDAPGNGTTPETPFLTLTYTEAAASDADDVYVANGTYTESQLVSAKAINWIGEEVTGTILQFTGLLRLIFLFGNSTRTFSNFRLEMDNPVAGAKYLVECDDNYDVNTTFTNCHFNNGRLRSILVPEGSSGLVLDGCTGNIDITSTAAFIDFVGSWTVQNTTITTSDGLAAGLFYQSAASTGNTVLLDGNTITMTNDAPMFVATAGVLVSPTITDNTITVSAGYSNTVIEIADSLNEVIDRNDISINSVDTGVNTIWLYSTTGTASVASIKSNTIKTYGNANHVIIVGSEDGVASVPNTYTGTVIEENNIYCGGYFGYAIGNIHAIMSGYDRCYIRNNKVFGAGLAVVYKHNGTTVAPAYASGNELYNCSYGFRIKGAPYAKMYGNVIKSTNSANNYSFSITDNAGGDPSINCEAYNNIVDVNSGVIMAPDVASETGLVADYNYYAHTGNFANDGTAYATLALWQAAKNIDLHSSLYNKYTKYNDRPIMSSSISFADEFKTILSERSNGLRTKKLALIKDNGLELDGTADYAKRNISNFQVGKALNMSLELEFTPDFAYTENATRYLFSLGTGYYLAKLNNAGSNVLRLYLGGTSIVDIASATYGAYWNVGSKNTIIVATSGTATDVYLNSNLIVSGDATAWVHTYQDTLNFGCDSSYANCFDGKIHKFNLYDVKLSALEVSRLYTKTMYKFDWLGEYPLLASTLNADVSGNGKHLVLGTGVATPTKLTTRGYSTDGGDKLISPNLSTSRTRITTAVVFERRTGSALTKVVFANETPALDHFGDILYYVANGVFRYFVGSVSADQRAIYINASAATAGIFVIIGTYDGTRTTLWVNGNKGSNVAVPIAPDITSNSVFSLFVRGDGATSSSESGCRILYAATGNFGITDMEVRYLTTRLMREYNLA